MAPARPRRLPPVKYIRTTPRQLMAQDAWEKARDILGWGQWVFDGGLQSPDDEVILTAGEARAAGYVPPRASWRARFAPRQLAASLASIGNTGGAFIASWGVTRILQHRPAGPLLLTAGLLLMAPMWIMLARSVYRAWRS